MVIRKLNKLAENCQKLQGNYEELTANYINMKKGIETTNKSQEEMNNTIYHLKNTVKGIKSRLEEAEYWISELEDKVEDNSQKGLRELQDNMKYNNTHIIGIPEGEEQQRIENLFEEVNFPNMMR